MDQTLAPDTSKPAVTLNQFLDAIAEKDNFKDQLVNQTIKDIAILGTLGMTKREISHAVGLSETRAKTEKATSAHPAATKKAGKAA